MQQLLLTNSNCNLRLSLGFYSYFFMLAILNETIRLYATPSESDSQFLESHRVAQSHVVSRKIVSRSLLAILRGFQNRLSGFRYRFQNKRIVSFGLVSDSLKLSVAYLVPISYLEIYQASYRNTRQVPIPNGPCNFQNITAIAKKKIAP